MLRFRPVGWFAALVLSWGCAYAYQTVRPAPRYWVSARPDPAYYCYDCHGYRYFDPYYDWCPNYGFKFRWEQTPQLVQVYREQYVSLKEKDRRLGRYRYAGGYRAARRYREPLDYDTWLESGGSREPDRHVRDSNREQEHSGRGKTKRAPSVRPKRVNDRSRGDRPQGAEL